MRGRFPLHPSVGLAFPHTRKFGPLPFSAIRIPVHRRTGDAFIKAKFLRSFKQAASTGYKPIT
jgi:hypothetical protein